jgi:hypothetical protein
MIRQRGFRLGLLVLVGAGALLATAASADWIVLDNGRKLEGKIEEKTDDTVRIKLAGGSVTVSRKRIQAIHEGDRPPTGDEKGDRVAHRGDGATRRPAEYRYLDGSDAVTGEVVQPRFTVMLPVGELAHGTLVELRDFRTMNGVEMAKVRVGDVEGWVPVASLRKAPRARIAPREGAR